MSKGRLTISEREAIIRRVNRNLTNMIGDGEAGIQHAERVIDAVINSEAGQNLREDGARERELFNGNTVEVFEQVGIEGGELNQLLIEGEK